MQRALAPMLFKDDDHDLAEAQRTSPVAPARRSPKALAKTTHQAHRASRTGAQLRHPAQRSRHRHREPHHPDRARTCPASLWSPPPPRFSAEPSNCWASRTDSATCSHVNPARTQMKGQVTSLIVYITGGNFGLEASVPGDVKARTRALAVDWSDHETFSCPPYTPVATAPTPRPVGGGASAILRDERTSCSSATSSRRPPW